jgi:hypothetical protein
MNVLIELIAKLQMEFQKTDILLVVINVLIVLNFGEKVIFKKMDNV